jgi:hypothetical protein
MPQTFSVPAVPGFLAWSRWWRVALLAGLVLSLGLASGVPVATSWTVCASGCDYSSIEVALAVPTTLNGDTLAVAAGTYTEPGILVNKSVTLQGEASATTIVQAAVTPGTASDRVFTIPSGVTMTLRELTIRHGSAVTPSGNSNSASGGGLFNKGMLTLINSIVSGNSAYYGGGLLNGHTLTLTSSTVSGNATTYYGGGLSNSFGTLLTLTNSIIASHSDGGDCRNVNGGSIRSDGYNLDSDGSCPLTAPTDRSGQDPLLGPLQDNGGPTLTQALLPGSPALDAIPWGTNGCGTTLIGDQRWQARPQAIGGNCDIAAYEMEVAGQPLSAWVTGLTPHTVVCTNVTTGQAVTFQHMVGATAASCVAAGLVVHPGDDVQIHAQGGAE